MATLPGTLILASTSAYRRELLQRLRLPFTTLDPAVDERPLAGEAPVALAMRLARDKALAVAARHPGATVIGSDQVGELDGVSLGKPGTHAAAADQLQRLSGRTAAFHTAVAVASASASTSASALKLDAVNVACVQVVVRFRVLSADDIAHYLAIDTPYDCAGSAKVESLGIALLESVVSDDPTALVGLPLIATCRLLRAVGFEPLAQATA